MRAGSPPLRELAQWPTCTSCEDGKEEVGRSCDDHLGPSCPNAGPRKDHRGGIWKRHVGNPPSDHSGAAPSFFLSLSLDPALSPPFGLKPNSQAPVLNRKGWGGRGGRREAVESEGREKVGGRKGSEGGDPQ